MAVLEYNRILIRKIETFWKIKTFADVTCENIADFDLFLRRTVNSQPTLYKWHSAFKSYIVDAMNRGLCRSNPYLQFKVSKGKSRTPVYLTEPELKAVLNFAPPTDRLQRVKDLIRFDGKRLCVLRSKIECLCKKF
ncbi:MAG: phage integrase SAM-like domain-containing protein [Tannerella sp.]|jgi:site-specific recombinase XerD|nr:phage integrase SAM-like domain-containing protein [Tannerella sp.]